MDPAFAAGYCPRPSCDTDTYNHAEGRVCRMDADLPARSTGLELHSSDLFILAF